MRTLFALGIAFAWLVGQPLTPCACEGTQESEFQPAKAVCINDITIPPTSVASGTVVLDVTISKEGEVRDIQVRRDIPSETEEALHRVRKWKFEPATLNGRAVASRTTIAVTFNPAPPLAENMPLPPLLQQKQEACPGPCFNPPGVIHATFPGYPLKAWEAKTVILEVSIDEEGNVKHADVLRDSPPFTSTCMQALDDWRFTPGTPDGKPVGWKLVLVFCFRVPMGWWP